MDMMQRKLAASEEQCRLLEEKYSTLFEMTKASTTPTWCIEFTEAVVLNSSTSEVVRQVFQNQCYWSMCNTAMADLYGLPDDLDFNNQPVNLYFPRSEDNEDFVLELIDNDFSVDRSLSVDTNYDGALVYIENTVRAKIRDGCLHRIWGTARDVTEDKRKHDRLVRRESEMRGVLSSVPDVILVVDSAATLLGANPAFESSLGWSVDDWLGRDISELVDLRACFKEISGEGNMGPIRFTVSIKPAIGEALDFDISLTDMFDEIRNDCYVVVMRVT